MGEVVAKVMKTVTEEFKESEKMLLELEEKQMLFERRIRQKDREFHMKMMKMFAGRLIQLDTTCTNHRYNQNILILVMHCKYFEPNCFYDT